MVVQHNLIAMNANRMLGLTEVTVSGSTEKLSSGYQINRAADNAAGLAISEKMRKQMRGLTRAAVNAEDGISSVQTAEGALSEVQDMLQRMNELCVQAANGTNSSTDRQYIQDEIDQLCTEIDRIAETTKFNDTYLLKGDSTAATERKYIMNYSVKETPNIVSNADENKDAMEIKVKYTGSNNVYMVSDDILTSNHNSAISADAVVSTGDDITPYMKKVPKLTYAYDASAKPTYNVTRKATENYYESGLNNAYNGWTTAVTYTKEDGYKNTLPELYKEPSTGTQDSTTQYVFDQADFTVNVTNGLYKDDTHSLDSLLGEAELQNYFDSEGNYLGGIYDSIGNEIELNDIENSVTKTQVPETDMENKVGAAFNTEEYVAFVAIALDSNLAEGSNGSVKGEDADDPTKTRDLSTDGITDIVRANKDLYLYSRENGTVTHLQAGDEMTKYLTEDRTMDDKYVLLGILDSAHGTSEVVKTQMLGGNTADNFTWSDSYIAAATMMQTLYDKNGKVVSGIRLNQFFDANGNYLGGLYTTEQARVIDQVFPKSAVGTDTYEDIKTALGKPAAIIDDYITTSSKSVAGELDFTLHVGADSYDENKITVTVSTLTAAGLGIDKIASDNLGIVDSTGQLATDAIDVIADALNDISRQRASLGAIQNRLEHTTKNLDNVVENTTAAESQIRDTDMATEMVRYANANILQQAGQSMLAQANQSNEGVLGLLQ